uniref:Peptidase A1 domain-containing protein n=1 Tax=Angiostrongylus cantonensis TaxID=6313 RepID=A0A0K0DN18_ANGCA
MQLSVDVGTASAWVAADRSGNAGGCCVAGGGAPCAQPRPSIAATRPRAVDAVRVSGSLAAPSPGPVLRREQEASVEALILLSKMIKYDFIGSDEKKTSTEVPYHIRDESFLRACDNTTSGQ